MNYRDFALLLFCILFFEFIVRAQQPQEIRNQGSKGNFFSYNLGNYDIEQVNQTRLSKSVLELKRNDILDSFALIRCKRMAKIIAQNPDAFCDEKSDIFEKEGHRHSVLPENTSCSIQGAGFKKDSLLTLDISKVYNRLVKGTLANPGLYLAGPGYNQSPSHLENRTNPNYKEYGSCYFLVFINAKNYNPQGMLPYIPTMIIIHYELFKS